MATQYEIRTKSSYALALMALGSSLLVLLLGACTVNHGDFSVISNKLIRTSNFELSSAERKQGIVGEDISRIIILFPTKAQVTMEEAVDDALEKADGDVMTDANVKFSSWYIPLIYGETKWTVKGDVVKTRKR